MACSDLFEKELRGMQIKSVRGDTWITLIIRSRIKESCSLSMRRVIERFTTTKLSARAQHLESNEEVASSSRIMRGF